MEVLFCGIPNGRTQKVQHQAAHRLLNWQLYQRGCTDFTMEYGRLGKPSLQAYPQLHFNLSHATGICVSAVGSFPMGVDVEPIRPLRPKVIRRICTEEERQFIAQASNPDEAFFRIWTLKESYVKAIGIGVSPFRHLRISGYLLLPAAFRSLSRLSSALSAKASTLRSFLLDLSFTISIAFEMGSAF